MPRHEYSFTSKLMTIDVGEILGIACDDIEHSKRVMKQCGTLTSKGRKLDGLKFSTSLADYVESDHNHGLIVLVKRLK